MATRTESQSPALYVAESHDLIRVHGAREQPQGRQHRDPEAPADGVHRRLRLGQEPAGIRHDRRGVAAADQGKPRFPGLLQSPLTDSNGRPPPYHALRAATGRNPGQRFWRVFAASVLRLLAAGCHRLQPLGSIKAPSSVVCAGYDGRRRASGWRSAGRRRRGTAARRTAW
jgi:hypothetical protein